MPWQDALVAPLQQLLHPLHVRGGALQALSWTTIPKGPKLHLLGRSEPALAGVLFGEGAGTKVPSKIADVHWRRGWTVAIPLVGGLDLENQRVEAQHLAVIPPGEDSERIQIDESGVVMFFHPGPHGCQRPACVRGSLEELIGPITVNRRFLGTAEREGLDGGAVAYPLTFIGCDSESATVNVSVLEIPSASRNERHTHGVRGELSLLIGRGGKIAVGDEHLTPGSFDLEGPGTEHQLRVLEDIWALQVSLDGLELQ